MGDKLTGRAMTKLDIFNVKATRKTDLPSLSTALSMSNDSGKPLSSRKLMESLKKNKGTQKMDYNFSTSEMFSDGQGESPNSLHEITSFSGSVKPVANSSPSATLVAFRINEEDLAAGTSESRNKRRKLDEIGNGNEFVRSMKKKSDMLPEKAAKKSDLPCLSSVLSKGNDSGKLSLSHKKIKKSKYNFINKSRNLKSTHQCIKKNKSIQKRNCDYSTSDTFSEGLSDSPNSLRKLASFTDCDKPVSNISPPVVNLVSPEYSSFKAIDDENFVVEINESGNEGEKKKKRIRNKLTKIEPKSLSKYSINPKSEYQRNIRINCNKNDDLKLADLFNDIENKTVVKSARSISTSSRQSSGPLEELLTDSSNVISPLSNYFSEISLTFPEPKSTSPISVGNRSSSFHTSQSAYLKRKMALVHKKRSKGKSIFAFKLCNSVIEDLSSLGSVSGLPVNLNDEYTPNYESQTNKNQKENQLEIPFSPKQQNSSENLGEHFLETNPVKSTKSDAITKCAKRRYPFDQSPNLYDTERNETYTVGDTGESMIIDGSRIASTVSPLCASTDQYSSQSQSTADTLTENPTKRSSNNFWNDSYEVQNFVRQWLNDENRSNNKTPKEWMGRNQYLLKHRHLIWNGINEIQDDLVIQKQTIDSGSEALLSNYSSEFDEAYKVRRFLPMSNFSHERN